MFKKSKSISVLLLLCTLSLVGCGGSSSDEQATLEIEEAIRGSIQASQDEDADAVLSFMDTSEWDEDQYNSYKSALQQSYEMYDSEIEVVSVEVLTTDKKDATARVVQTAKYTGTPVIPTATYTILQHLKKVDEKWLLSESEIENVEQAETTLEEEAVSTTPETAAEPIDDDAAQEIEAALQAYVLAMQNEDIDAYFEAVDDAMIDEATRNSLIEQLNQLFQSFDLTYELTDIEVLSTNEEDAKVRATQTTKKVAGEDEYQDTVMVAVYHMRKVDGKWKLTSTDVESVSE